MTDLVVRKIVWEFDDSVPFMWQPKNPSFGLFCNAFTFIAVPFERYIVSAVRKAQDKLNEDPEVASEADAFLRQEAQHAAAHRKHMIALIQRCPIFQDVPSNQLAKMVWRLWLSQTPYPDTAER